MKIVADEGIEARLVNNETSFYFIYLTIEKHYFKLVGYNDCSQTI